MKRDVCFWDDTWGKPYGRYHRHHQIIWNALAPSGNIVDLGCGACVMYEGKQVSLVGVDWSAEALLQAKKHYPCGVYIQADVSATGLPTGQFDSVIALGLLDYFDDWIPVYNEMLRLCKPGGKIYATLLNGFQNHIWTEETARQKASIKSFRHVCSNWFL